MFNKVLHVLATKFVEQLYSPFNVPVSIIDIAYTSVLQYTKLKNSIINILYFIRMFANKQNTYIFFQQALADWCTW